MEERSNICTWQTAWHQVCAIHVYMHIHDYISTLFSSIESLSAINGRLFDAAAPTSDPVVQQQTCWCVATQSMVTHRTVDDRAQAADILTFNIALSSTATAHTFSVNSCLPAFV